jgi:hypothetical protein
MKRLCLGIIVALGLTLPAFGQEPIKAPDGIYVLNLAKSNIRGAAPKSETFSLEGDTITVIGFGFDGKPRSFTGKNVVDGKPHPTTGSPLFDTEAFTQLNSYTIGITRTKDGQVTPTGISTFNPKTNEITLTIYGTNGRYNNLMVYEKQ